MTLAAELQPFVALRARLNQVIIGQPALIDRLVIALLAGGHVLLEGPPGLAKTTAAHAVARLVDASFQRIQFTPDLMPSDLTGSDIWSQQDGSFSFVPGPLFHQIVLADEINRAPPKVQAALLEAMAEQQITVGGRTRRLPELFLVMATQNPLEQAGTYALPEAQLDRFLFHVPIDYPNAEDELAVVRQARLAPDPAAGLAPLVHPDAVLAARHQLADIHIEPSLEQYAVALVQASRDLPRWCPEWPEALAFGASPRGAIAMLRAATALAALRERDYVIPDDLIELAPDVLRHRLVLGYQADAEGLSADRIVTTLLERVPVP